ncbi:DNA fragmentation factor subunit alpha-like [Toxorhynchites rutilus septentrionalis]|uniref:DNA fragmentation factor subunit alpha-like n=1 Tax=Toxorhynchites rutilus septentrionalis TaxID=329112 RepID=UPI00247A3968|nr:DNA fragmentation factor subunit alpha-like [Toxorhynchites rutilus septentrionalis]
MEDDNKKPYKIKDVTRTIRKAVVASSLEELRTKAAAKFGRADLPNIHWDSDGTEIDDEEYFQSLEPETELIAAFTNEKWIDPTQYVSITTQKESDDTTDSPEVERIHLTKLVAQMKSNLCNVSVLNEPDLELLSNMDPNSVADITGRDFIEQLKEASGRILFERRQALDAIELLKMIAKQKAAIPSVVHNIPGGEPSHDNANDNEYDMEGGEQCRTNPGDDDDDEDGRCPPPDEIDSANNKSSGTANSSKQITLELDPRTLATFHQQQKQCSANASNNNPSDTATTAVTTEADNASSDSPNRCEMSNI